MDKRLKGLGFSLVWNGYVVVSYYVPILAWVMAYFRRSFSNPLPWQGDHVNFYHNEIFFSIGLGMGYCTSYASYNNQHQNVVQDVLIIIVCNSLYEIVGCFAIFGIIGFLQQFPQPGDDPVGGFAIAFLTYPAGVAEMPGA
ncbi:putative creatine transporter [Diaporthe ampelina]|uniref:Putative creatine transporter n=1 Tax=Diaporthe ampelina TaxID=1214573 RepID=A0A0G2FLF7_9PEZI|nr:putative creatine transporter [Diaporthe ampelina]